MRLGHQYGSDMLVLSDSHSCHLQAMFKSPDLNNPLPTFGPELHAEALVSALTCQYSNCGATSSLEYPVAAEVVAHGFVSLLATGTQDKSFPLQALHQVSGSL